jgi:hypothetical protein
MKLRFHKIAPEGKSVIYPKEDDEDGGHVIPLNIIVLPSQRKKSEE